MMAMATLSSSARARARALSPIAAFARALSAVSLRFVLLFALRRRRTSALVRRRVAARAVVSSFSELCEKMRWLDGHGLALDVKVSP